MQDHLLPGKITSESFAVRLWKRLFKANRKPEDNAGSLGYLAQHMANTDRGTLSAQMEDTPGDGLTPLLAPLPFQHLSLWTHPKDLTYWRARRCWKKVLRTRRWKSLKMPISFLLPYAARPVQRYRLRLSLPGDRPVLIPMIDTHAHLNDPKLISDLDELIVRARSAGARRSYRVRLRYSVSRDRGRDGGGLRGRVCDRRCSSARCKELRCLSRAGAFGAFSARKSPGNRRNRPGLPLRFQPTAGAVPGIRVANRPGGKLGLPIVVHSRESNPEAMQVLRKHSANILGCVFHCFSGDEDFAREVLDMGYYIGIDGPVTYNAAVKLKRIVQICPLERLLIETDCPYLTPAPFQASATAAYVRYVAEEVARLKGISVEELAEATTINARRLFPRLE